MTIKNLTVTGLASATIVVMAAAPVLACNTKPVQKVTDHKVGICHATGSKTNPYVFIVVDTHAEKAHTSHQDGRDIVGAKSLADCPKPAAVHTTPAPTPSPKTTPAPVATTPVQGNGNNGQVLATSTTAAQTLPTQLPDTGSTAGLSALLGLPTLALAGRAYLRSRTAR